jgi:D-sedoheptulose 7-phosphate isomerase
MNTLATINSALAANLSLAQELIKRAEEIKNLAAKFSACLKAGGKLIFFGNGGSAADAMHIAAEYSSKGLAAFTLSENISAVTAIGNDASYDSIFSMQIKALTSKNDLAIALSTSGESKNIITAIEQCKKSGIATAAFTGSQKNSLAKAADVCFEIPSNDTARIQEAYLLVNHIIYSLIKNEY